MYVLGNFFIAAGQIVSIVLTIYTYVLIAAVLITWVNPDPYNPIVQFLRRVTEPVLAPLRRVIPPLGGLDLSPIAALLLLQFFQMFAVRTLVQFGYNLSGGM